MKPEQMQDENFAQLIERGPGLYPKHTWIAKKDTAHGLVLIAGLGAMGCGQMIFKLEPHHMQEPNYAEAPDVDLLQGL
jgi:hypothetical protein